MQSGFYAGDIHEPSNFGPSCVAVQFACNWNSASCAFRKPNKHTIVNISRMTSYSFKIRYLFVPDVEIIVSAFHPDLLWKDTHKAAHRTPVPRDSASILTEECCTAHWHHVSRKRFHASVE